jgi:hypothetical protein
MERKFLEELKLDKETVEKIMSEHGRAMQEVQRKLTLADTERAGLKQTVAQREKDLADLKKNVGDNAELKKQIEDLQKSGKTEKDALQQKITDTQKEAAIKIAVAGKAHDPDIISGLIDKSKIELDEGGKLKSGLKEQLETLEKDKAFLFVSGKPKVDGAHPTEGSGGNGEDVDAALIDAAFEIAAPAGAGA